MGTEPPMREIDSFHVTLRCKKAVSPEDWLATAVHGWFFRCLETRSPDYAHDQHPRTDFKNFTLRLPCAVDAKAWPTPRSYEPGTDYVLGITALESSLVRRMDDWCECSGELPPVEVAGGIFDVVDVARVKTPVRGRDTYAGIFKDVVNRKPRLDHELTLDFVTPTCVARDRETLPLPLPDSLFGQLARKWNTFSQARWHIEEIEETVRGIRLASCRKLNTRPVRFSGYFKIGFVGRCRFSLARELTDEQVNQVRVLAAFAPFAGMGYGTTRGMGQVRGLPLRR